MHSKQAKYKRGSVSMNSGFCHEKAQYILGTYFLNGETVVFTITAFIMWRFCFKLWCDTAEVTL